MSLSRTVSVINGNFSRESPIFPTPVYLTPPLKGFPWNLLPTQGLVFNVLGTLNPTNSLYRRKGQKTRMMELPDGQNNITIGLAFWVQYGRVTDGQTRDDSKDRAYA